jgi:hypothetical protein
MTTVFIEARPKGRREGTAIVDYVVEEQKDRFLKAFKTQAEAITWAKNEGHSPHVARVRHLNDKKIPDHWRPVWYSSHASRVIGGAPTCARLASADFGGLGAVQISSSEAPHAPITLAALLHLGQPATRDLATFHRVA